MIQKWYVQAITVSIVARDIRINQPGFIIGCAEFEMVLKQQNIS